MIIHHVQSTGLNSGHTTMHNAWFLPLRRSQSRRGHTYTTFCHLTAALIHHYRPYPPSMMSFFVFCRAHDLLIYYVMYNILVCHNYSHWNAALLILNNFIGIWFVTILLVSAMQPSERATCTHIPSVPGLLHLGQCRALSRFPRGTQQALTSFHLFHT